MVFLLAAGTGFDYYLESLKKSKMMAKNCSHYNATLEMNVPDMKSRNGKLISMSILPFYVDNYNDLNTFRKRWTLCC